MELTKKEMILVITALTKLKDGWEGINEEFVKNLKMLIHKFDTYLDDGEHKFEWIDLTELATKKYPHLGDDCE
jgi:hypothetical protein|tara:strand:- start:97 stop:315 length:219 start_codon:yes stop_codon:yes gene_type:complete